MVQDLGFTARCATERDDSGEVRLNKIMEIIAECKYGIHDISRAQANTPDLPRFNMPYELGLFMGCQRYGVPKQRHKITLILDSERYRYQQFLSDIAGQDIKAHADDPRRVVEVVRKWLGPTAERTRQHGAQAIWERFQPFQMALPDYCADPAVNMTPDELRASFAEYVQLMVNFSAELDA